VRTIPEDYGEFIIEVKDNGIGFSKSKGEDIFELFTRLHDHVEGSGIGLYIVKRIAENSGGRVVVESQPGLGSVFQVHIKSRKNDSGT
jgi:signal transduction histidine kinase